MAADPNLPDPNSSAKPHRKIPVEVPISGRKIYVQGIYAHALLNETRRIFPREDQDTKRLKSHLIGTAWDPIDPDLVSEALRRLAEQWARSPFPEKRFNTLVAEDRDLELTEADRVVVFHRAALRSGVRERIDERDSTKPFRNAITEEATELVRGLPRPKKNASRQPRETVAETAALEVLQFRRAGANDLPPTVVEFWEREMLVLHATDREKDAWRLRRQGLKYREIADQLGITTGRVGQLLHNLREKLIAEVS